MFSRIFLRFSCIQSFSSIGKCDRNAYIKLVEEKLPAEIPQMFGLHPNAEIGYLTTLGEKLF